MTAAIAASLMLGKTWYTPGQDDRLKMQDVNGVSLVVGQTVKIIGTIIAVDSEGHNFNNVQVKVNNPSGTANTLGAGGLVLKVHPLSVAVGS